MSIRHHHVIALVLCFVVVLNCFQENVRSADVALDSIAIFKTHEWFKAEPTVYFNCKGENITVLPDVKKPNAIYSFKGEESWQPLTEFPGTKCKRCGIYEKDTIGSDDVFDEWEFCPSDFDADGKYVKIKEKEFNATFQCTKCVASHASASNTTSGPSHHEKKGAHIALVLLITAVVSAIMIAAAVVGFKYWQRKKREHDQARFLKLFEDGDDIEDELDLGTVI